MAELSNDSSENRSVYRLRWVGYGFLVFALVDLIASLIPSETFTNNTSQWLFQTIGKLVETSVVPLLGFAFVFFGEFFARAGIEKILLKILSWVCLLLTVISLLLIPPLIGSTLQLTSQSQAQINQALQQEQTKADLQLTQITQLESQLNNSNPEQLEQLRSQLTQLNIGPIPNNPQELKTTVLSRIKEARGKIETGKNTLQQQAEARQASQRNELLKNSVKWSIGAIIAAVLFFILWKSTGWARA
ncbi:HpsJ family protein [Pantanalinema rosaneae CENA516]|uniref:HpsJ-like protein, cyanoexosortase A-associated n=1 Tax=Pantanalinema rosaneae TaxID=1620701 RepID=UPI003D6F2E2C